MLVVVAAAFFQACVPPRPQLRSETSNSRRGSTWVRTAAFALYHGCPLPGTPRDAARRAMGRPSATVAVEQVDGGAQDWLFDVGGAGVLVLRLAADTVQFWTVRGVAGDWRPARRPHIPTEVRRRVARYLGSAPSLSPEVVYAMYNRCVLVGMSGALLQVSQGVPSFLEPVAAADGAANCTRWVYVIGLEGQKLVVDVDTVADRVVGWGVRDTYRTMR